MCQYIIIQRGEVSSVVGEHDAEGAARQAAEELAAGAPSVAFEVFQYIGVAREESRVVWKGVKG
jgi:hypothetical protein